MRVVHSQHQKAKVRVAIEPLGAHLVAEFEDHNAGNRYMLTATAIFLTRNGPSYRRLFVQYLEFLRALFLENPEKLNVTDGEIAKALKLSAEQINILGHLLSLRPFYDRSGGSAGWTARSRTEVEDFPPEGTLDGALDAILVRDKERSEPVYIDKRRSIAQVTSVDSFFGRSVPDAVMHVDALKRRYQVFVSSTYEDLKDERRHVMQALLETKCIPTGMEMFPASSTEQWNLIQRVIDECDYYIVILAGRYGSIGKTGVSYTEQEFDYAVRMGKPVIGFYHRDLDSLPGKKLQSGDDARAKLATFAKKVKERLCRGWSTPEELGSAVKSAILNELEFNPRPGWIRADAVPSSEGVEKLKQRIADLEEQLKKRTNAKAPARRPESKENGNAPIHIQVEAVYWSEKEKNKEAREIVELVSIRRTWDELLLLFSDHLQERTQIQNLRTVLEKTLVDDATTAVSLRSGKSQKYVTCKIAPEFFDRLVHTLATRKLVRLDLPRSTWGSREMEARLAPKGIERLAELKSL